MNEQPVAKFAHDDILRLTTEIAASYLGNNALPAAQIPEVINTVYGALASLGNGAGNKVETPKPAVPIKKSIAGDFIVCLEDGKKLKMLKRYLRSAYGMTPDDYRAKWGLGPDYPMVAPNYAAQRSAFAKKIGLGRAANKARARKGKN
jgi:predicted transcriptional regulator